MNDCDKYKVYEKYIKIDNNIQLIHETGKILIYRQDYVLKDLKLKKEFIYVIKMTEKFVSLLKYIAIMIMMS